MSGLTMAECGPPPQKMPIQFSSRARRTLNGELRKRSMLAYNPSHRKNWRLIGKRHNSGVLATRNQLTGGMQTRGLIGDALLNTVIVAVEVEAAVCNRIEGNLYTSVLWRRPDITRRHNVSRMVDIKAALQATRSRLVCPRPLRHRSLPIQA